MAAGLGFKTFTTGEVLTAANVNGYLMQGILVFASAAARDSAITSPQEGQACYLKDTNEVLTYSGSAWVAVGGASGGYTSLASGSLTGATVSLSSISASYQKLVLVLRNMSLSGSDEFTIRLNGSSSSIYGYYNVFSNSTPEIKSSTAAASVISFTGNMDAANTAAHIVMEFDDYASAATQIVTYYGAYKRSSYGAIGAFTGVGIADTQTAINAIELKANYGGAYTFDNGTYELFGVK
jgi:hypothetical protein